MPDTSFSSFGTSPLKFAGNLRRGRARLKIMPTWCDDVTNEKQKA